MPKPMSVSMLGVRPARAMASATGSMRARMPERWSGEMKEPLFMTGRPVPRSSCSCSWKSLERLAGQAAHDLAARAAGLDEAGDPQPAQMPGDERLAEVDVAHQVGDRAVALGEALQDAQARRVRQRLVDHGHGLQVSRRVGQAGDRGADARGAWQGWVSGVRGRLETRSLYISEC